MGSFGQFWAVMGRKGSLSLFLGNCSSRQLEREVILDFFFILFLSVENISRETRENSEKNFQREKKEKPIFGVPLIDSGENCLWD